MAQQHEREMKNKLTHNKLCGILFHLHLALSPLPQAWGILWRCGCRFGGAQREFMNVQMCTTISRINVSYCPRHPPAPTRAWPTGTSWVAHPPQLCGKPSERGEGAERNRVEDACAHSPWHSAQASCGKFLSSFLSLSLSLSAHTHTVRHS